MTSAEMMERTGISSKPYFMKNYIRPALECGAVEMTCPDSPHSSRQRYRKAVR